MTAQVPYARLSSFYFFHFATLGGLLPFLALYLDSMGFSATQIGQLMALFAVTKLVAPNVWGWLADRNGGPLSLIRWAGFLTVLCFSTLLFADGFWAVAGGVVAFSFFWNAALPPYEALTLNHLGPHTRYYSLVRLWGSVGFILVAGSFGWAFDRFSPLWLPMLLLPVFAGIWFSTLLTPDHPLQAADAPHQPLRAVLAHPSVLGFLAAAFLLHFSHGPYYTFFTLYLEDLGYGRGLIGLFWVVGVVAEILLFLVFPRLFQSYSARHLFLVALAATAVRWFVTALFADVLLLVFLVQTLHLASFGICHVVAMHYVHRFFPGPLQGRGQGLYSSLGFGAGGALGSFLSGYVWHWGGGSAIFAMATIAVLAGLIIAWMTLPRRELPVMLGTSRLTSTASV
ncbi:MAG: MFS transporter [Pseudomonadota bacterium]|nr:MFS transporter [Pseudomonadota bacterium]